VISQENMFKKSDKHDEVKKKKVLLVTFRFPFPNNDGAKIRVVNFIYSVFKEFDIYLYSLDFKSINTIEIEHALKFCKEVYTFKINTFISLLKLPFVFIFTKKPIQTIFFNNKKMKNILKNEYFNVIYFNSIRMIYFNKFIKKDTSILDFVDAASMNYNQKKEKINFVLKSFYYFESARMLKYEIESQNTIDKFVIISDVDKNYLYDYGFNKDLVVIGNYVKDIDLNKYNKVFEQNNTLSFMGKMTYEPNFSAVRTYIEKIEPDLKNYFNDMELIVIGEGVSSKLRNLALDSNVHFAGFVEDPYALILKSKIFIAPMVSGAGLQNKILEAMYIGKCVVTTKLGSEGLLNLKGDELVIVDEIDSFSKKIHELINDEEKLLKIGLNAHNYVMENFSKQSISKKYIDMLRL
jgi:glycosyltransferase involved in cell wall biosynthesis